jgi:hypothetical protein
MGKNQAVFKNQEKIEKYKKLKVGDSRKQGRWHQVIKVDKNNVLFKSHNTIVAKLNLNSKKVIFDTYCSGKPSKNSWATINTAKFFPNTRVPSKSTLENIEKWSGIYGHSIKDKVNNGEFWVADLNK